MPRLFFVLPLYVACEGEPPEASPSTTDIDADGYTADVDCDDYDAGVHPEAAEACDGEDDDCDGDTDEGAFRTFYADGDADGFGDTDAPTEACDLPTGHAETGGDCDDGDGDVHPGAAEVCDDVDDDCDDEIDEADAVDAGTWYSDADADGFGDEAATTVACDAPPDHVDVGGDCDDDDAEASPAGVEVCGGADEDCDGDVDEADAADAETWFTDGDGDGFGDAGTVACEPPDGTVADGGDCDDADPFSYPGGAELCGGGDEDCDGEVDEPEAAERTWYADEDGDGYGLTADSVVACDPGAGWAVFPDDCDDADPDVFPDATEVCDAVDADCDGDVDDGEDAPVWYRDADADGYGDLDTVSIACDAPSGYVGTGTDCDDDDEGSYPDAPETCDDTDEDCDGAVDDDPTDAPDWYTDEDGDGYGDAFDSTACDAPSGTVANDDDCDDGDGAVSPGDAEVCDDDIDQDCSGTADDGCAVERCGPVTADATWTGESDVTCNVIVVGGVTLTLADGASVAFDAGTSLTVYGALAAGAASVGGDVTLTAGSVADFVGTTMSGALDAGAGTLTVSGSAFSGAVTVSPDNAGGLDDASSYTVVTVEAGPLGSDATWAAIATPWTIAGDVEVTAALTLTSGAELRFETDAGLSVAAGSLSATGVTFTSAQAVPAAGDWDGLTLGAGCGTVTLDGVTVSYGGGNGFGDVLFQACDGTLTGSTITDSAAWGVYVDSASPSLSGNTFSDNAAGSIGP